MFHDRWQQQRRSGRRKRYVGRGWKISWTNDEQEEEEELVENIRAGV